MENRAWIFALVSAGILVLAVLLGGCKGGPQKRERYKTVLRIEYANGKVICEGEDKSPDWPENKP